MNILGVKIDGHDPCAALISHGKVVALAEERLSRIKHAFHRFPQLSIAYCLSALRLAPAQVDMVVVVRASRDYQEKRSALDVFERETAGAFRGAQIETVFHHDAHAASAFFCSPFDYAAVLVYDGSGDYLLSSHGVVTAETETLYVGTGNRLRQIDKTTHAKSGRHFLYSMGIGKLYELLSQHYLGFGAHNEGKMMGLAAYGDRSFLEMFPYERWVREYQGQLLCNCQLNFEKADRMPVSGVPESDEANEPYQGLLHQNTENVAPQIFERLTFPRAARDPKKDRLPDQYYSSVAYAGQKIFERFAIEIGLRLKDITRADSLCVAGGCGLNIDANRNFLTEAGFKNIFVQPGSSDCGLALGAALYGWHMIAKKPRFWTMETASLGRPYTDQDIRAALGRFSEQVAWRECANVENEAADLIARGSIIGWFSGGAEHGPRALGNRSILCDARDPAMKDTVNLNVKYRETWRPLAASILAERASEWFDIDIESPFMLLAAQVKAEKKKLVPSIVHVDGTCRIQTVTTAANARFYRLLKAFETKTGTPLVLNTSFNLAGEPIVESPDHALETYLRMGMDYLVLENFIVKKNA